MLLPMPSLMPWRFFLKICNDADSLNGLYSFDRLIPGPFKSDSKVDLIVGSVVGFVALLGLLATFYFLFCDPSSKLKYSHSAWLPFPLHGGNSHSMGS